MNQAKTKNVLDRVSELENTVQQITGAVQVGLMQTAQVVGQHTETLEALTEILGKDAVDQALKTVQQRKVEQMVVNATKALEEALAKGQFVKAEKVQEKSLIVGRELDKDGVVVGPSQIQVNFSQFIPELKEGLLNSAEGTKVPTPAGGVFEVLSVYDPVIQVPATAGA